MSLVFVYDFKEISKLYIYINNLIVIVENFFFLEGILIFEV